MLPINRYQNIQVTLDYIKNHLGHPYQIIELSDDEIVKKVIHGTGMQIFSNFVPMFEFLYYQRTDYIDTTGRKQLINLSNIISPDPQLITIDPTLPQAEQDRLQKIKDKMIANRLEELSIKERFISVQDVMNETQMSITYKMYNHDKIMIDYTGNEIMVKVKCRHINNLSSIPARVYERFNHLCLIETSKLILPIRKFNSQISTPLGDIVPDLDTPQTLVDSYEEFINTKFDIARNISVSHGIPVMFFDDGTP